MKYVRKPYIPENKVKLVVIDSRISINIKNIIRAEGIDFIEVPYCKDLYKAISSHPDIFIYPSEEGVIIAPNLYDELKTAFIERGIDIIKGESILNSTYPYDIAYNVCRIGNYAIHNFNYTDSAILKSLKKNSVKMIHVKQGYAKCSVCVVNEEAIITSDKGIARETQAHGIDTLLISAGDILLDGLDHGFIGGATGLISKNKLFVCGDISRHRNYNDITKFLLKHNVNLSYVRDNDIYDCGSIIPISEC